MKTGNAKILLTAVFVARGTSFLFSKTLMQTMPPVSILAVRFTIAFLILSAIFFRKMKDCDRNSLKGGVTLGILYTIVMIFEMFGLRLIDSGVSALVENQAIVIVPLLIAAASHTLPARKTIFCALMAVAGVGFLSLTQLDLSGGLAGIGLMLCAAVSYAVCIITTGKVAGKGDPITIGMIQMGTMGALSMIISLCTQTLRFPQGGHQWSMLMALVLIGSCFGFTFQPLGQKYVPAETAAVFTVVNPLTASLMGILIAGEEMSVVKLIGYVLILGALFYYNMHSAKRQEIKERK